jgi:hypothetical protein
VTATPLLLFLIAAQAAGPDSGRGWQQEVSYRISAALDEDARLLRGRQEVIYRNQSPDTLRSLVFHLDLNAYRPGSRWASSDAARGSGRLDRRPADEFGFTNVRDFMVGGLPRQPSWPFAPDSTSVLLALPEPLVPGDSIVVTMSWESRPATAPGVVGQRGRQFDFPASYPRLAPYGRRGWVDHPRLPGTERSGEFASYLFSLDVPRDQVVGAAGVPLCGDPGWESARFLPAGPVTYQRDWYQSFHDPAAARVAADSSACAPTASGRKTIIWYAEQVPDFGLAMSPEFRYEEGDLFQRPVRALYRSGGEAAWGAGLVTGWTESAIAWLAEILGRSPWPQTTVVQGLEAPGTGMPMLSLAAAPSRGEILRLLGHTSLAEAIGVDGWSDGWLDGGLTNFQSTLYFQALGEQGAYSRLERTVLDWDLDGLSQPVGLPPDQFRDPVTASAMVNQRGELFFHQMRTAVGGNATMRAILRAWYDRYRLQRADGADFLALAASLSGADLSALSAQWLHGTALYDYALERSLVEPAGQGRWRTTIDVRRRAPGIFPVDVGVRFDDVIQLARATGQEVEQRLEIVTPLRPERITQDPAVRSHDWNMLNNRPPPTSRYLDTYFTRHSRRNGKTLGVAPTAWYNDAGGWTFGLRARTDYLDRFDLNEAWLGVSSGWGADSGRVNPDLRLVLKNPVRLRATGVTQQLGLRWGEGRAGADIAFEKTFRRSLADRGERALGLSLAWVTVTAPVYVDSSQYDDAGTVELTASGWRTAPSPGGWQLQLTGALAGGFQYRNAAGSPSIGNQLYVRITVAATAHRPLARRLHLGARLFAGATVAGDSLVLQRQIYLAGADPYQQLHNPFLRSRGAILAREGVNYLDPGGAGVRGLAPATSAGQAYGVSAELEWVLRRGRGLGERVSLALFGDAALADGDLAAPGGSGLVGVADAGFGIRVDNRIGRTPFQLRFDFPVWISRPALALDQPASSPFAFRWSFSFKPAF